MGPDETVKPEKGAGGRGPGAGVSGTVVEERPALVYVVRLGSGQQVLAHVVGTVKRNFVRLEPGDRVEVTLMPHDPRRARITRKLSGGDGPLAPGPRPPAPF